VHIVKKSSNKWECKVCSSKQSVVQVFAQGPASECRDAVQKLNFVRGTALEKQREDELQKALLKEEEEKNKSKVKPVSQFNIQFNLNDSDDEEDNEPQHSNFTSSSRWTKYLDIEKSTPEALLD